MGQALTMIVGRPLTTIESSLGVTSGILCPVAIGCGGCPHIFDPIETQRSLKASQVGRLLADAHVSLPHAPVWIVGPATGYRNRIRLAVVDGVPRFFNAEKSLTCTVLEPSLQAALNDFLDWSKSYRTPLRGFRVAEVRAPDADGKAAVYLRHTERNGAQVAPPDRNGLPSSFASGVVGFEGGPVEYQRHYATSDVWLWSPVGGFGQINSLVNQRMVQTVVEWLLARAARTFLDLFAGSGNFSVPLRANGIFGTAVEWDAIACEAHERTLSSHGLDRVSVKCGDALQWAERLKLEGAGFDTVVVDPPRRGLRGNVQAIACLARDSIVLVSCNASQFASDAAALCAQGFGLADLRLVDMFPHTDHVELIALFTHQSSTET